MANHALMDFLDQSPIALPGADVGRFQRGLVVLGGGGDRRGDGDRRVEQQIGKGRFQRLPVDAVLGYVLPVQRDGDAQQGQRDLVPGAVIVQVGEQVGDARQGEIVGVGRDDDEIGELEHVVIN